MGLQVKPLILGDQFAASASASASAAAKPQVAEREMIERQRPRPRPPSKEQALHCPRCKSTNTKFCYYNNYSLTQPRYFCKTCRRYWTDGGSLRNVPVGGGSRKNKNKTVAASAAAAAADTTTPSSKAQKLFPESNTIWQESSSNSYNLSAMDMLKSSTAVPDYTGAGFEGFMQEFIRPPAISFPLDSAAGSSKLMFPLEEQNKGQGGGGDPASGYWNGMLMGGGGSW